MQSISKLKRLIKGDRMTKIIIAMGIIGIVLIFISTLDIENSETQQLKSTADEYINKIEGQIGEIVRKITGEKDAAVMVSLESSGEIIYADAKSISTNKVTDKGDEIKYKTQQNDNTEQSYIIVENANGDQQALIVSELAPTIRGVVVVTEYADNTAVCERITSAITTVLNVPSKKVCVVSAN